ncbi:MAG: helix-turn-helix transcriptional regulator, partial [Planctomycetota bacterium]
AFATLLRFIEGRAGQRLMVEDLELFTGLGRSRVHQLFRRHVGQSPGAYLLHRRLRVAADRLRETGDDVTDIALDLEFASSQHLATAFRRRYGLSPTAFRAAAM